MRRCILSDRGARLERNGRLDAGRCVQGQADSFDFPDGHPLVFDRGAG